MGLRRFANKRDANEPEIVSALETLGCVVRRMDTPCDLLIKVPGVRSPVLAEVKMPKGVITKDQQDFMAAGFEVWILRDVQDAITMCNMVRRLAA